MYCCPCCCHKILAEQGTGFSFSPYIPNVQKFLDKEKSLENTSKVTGSC